MNRRSIAFSFLLLLSDVPLYAKSSDAAVNWSAISACAQERSDSRRHACMDAVLRTAGVLDPLAEREVQRDQFGKREDPAAAVARTIAVPTVTQSGRTAPPLSPPLSTIDRIETIVKESLITNDRKLVIATAEGAVWKQLDGPRFRREPKQGTPFTVLEGALGSYRCKVGSDIYLCRRMD